MKRPDLIELIENKDKKIQDLKETTIVFCIAFLITFLLLIYVLSLVK